MHILEVQGRSLAAILRVFLFAILVWPTLVAPTVAQSESAVLEQTPRVATTAKLFPSEHPGLLRVVQPHAQKYSAIDAKRLISVREAASRKHPDFDSYRQATLSSRRGTALEAEFMGTLRRHYEQVGELTNRKLVLTALVKGDDTMHSGYHDWADVVDIHLPSGQKIRYQLKAGSVDTLSALTDLRYKGMYIVTTQDSRRRVLEGIRKSRSSLEGRLAKLNPADADRANALRQELQKVETLEQAAKRWLADQIPPSSVSQLGQPLPTEARILEVAKNALIDAWNRTFQGTALATTVAKTNNTRPRSAKYPRLVPNSPTQGARRAWLANLTERFSALGSKGTRRAIKWIKVGGARALGPLGAALSIKAASNAVETWRSGEGSDTYFALKAGAMATEGYGGAWAFINSSGRVASRVVVRLAAAKAAGTLAATPEPAVTKVTALLIVAGIALDVAAERVLDAQREVREVLYGNLTVDERFNHRVLEVQGRADILRARVGELRAQGR